VALTEPIRLPAWPTPRQWCRVAWVSQRAKDVWAPRVSRINRALEEIELESALRGVRPGAMLFKSPEEVVALTPRALAAGCAVMPLSLQGTSSGMYTSQSAPYQPGQPFSFRVAVTREPGAWEPWARGDELAIGELLGYPRCCSEFYQRVWIEDGWRDTTLPMSQNGTDGPPEANILLRWLGVRLVRHLPCSFACEESARIGRETAALGRELRFADEIQWALEMLSWNVEWSSLHGVAEIKTPVCRISASTDPLATKAVVRKVGTVYPAEGATGLDFPFRQLAVRKVTESKSFAESVGLRLESAREWRDNGFGSRAAMDAAHDAILATLRAVDAAAWRGSPQHHVLDLGCGNGALLEKVCALFPGAVPHGVEIDVGRARRAYDRLSWGFIRPGNIADLTLWDGSYDLALFMPGRLAEMKPDEAERVVQQLSAIPNILLYRYDGRSELLDALDDYYVEARALERDGIRTRLLTCRGSTKPRSTG